MVNSRVREVDYLHDREPPDHFIRKDGIEYAGTHLIVDMWNAHRLDDIDTVDTALRKAAADSGATLLNIDLHKFSPNGGISGVAVLAESHISIHTWPERRFAAVDIFMCGDAVPLKAVPVLRAAFSPESVTLVEHRRGLMP